MLMHRFGKLSAALTLGALAALPLAAQSPTDLADARRSGAHVGGWESVTVPAGTFRALHVTTDDGGEVWASREVPFGLVKTHGKQGDLALTGRGTDAKSSITETPLEMPALPMPKN